MLVKNKSRRKEKLLRWCDQYGVICVDNQKRSLVFERTRLLFPVLRLIN
jgi:hypothetical protein